MKKLLLAVFVAAFAVLLVTPAGAQYPPPVGVPGDIDGDGIPDTEDDDADGDGIPNAQDPDADGNGVPDTEQPDSDGDGLIDVLDGTDNNDTGGDGDGDGDAEDDGAAGGDTGSPTPGDSGLATTGINSGTIAAIAATLLLIGTALVVGYRRRGTALAT